MLNDRIKEYKAGLWGRKIKSDGKGQGLGYGKGKGKVGIPIGEKSTGKLASYKRVLKKI